MSEQKPVKTRKPRRNFERELASLKTYTEIRLEVMKECIDPNAEDPSIVGQITALEGVLKRIAS